MNRSPAVPTMALVLVLALAGAILGTYLSIQSFLAVDYGIRTMVTMVISGVFWLLVGVIIVVGLVGRLRR